MSHLPRLIDASDHVPPGRLDGKFNWPFPALRQLIFWFEVVRLQSTSFEVRTSILTHRPPTTDVVVC